MSTPEIRGSWYRSLVAVAPPGAEAPRAPRPGAWVPASALVEIARGVLEAGGPPAVRGWAMRGCLAAMQTEPFRPYAEAARAEGGCEPGALMARACEAAREHLRGCGAFEVAALAEDGATVVEAPLPPELRVDAWLLTLAGMIEAFPIACGLEAEVSVRSEPGRASYDVGWWVPGALDR